MPQRRISHQPPRDDDPRPSFLQRRAWPIFGLEQVSDVIALYGGIAGGFLVGLLLR